MEDYQYHGIKKELDGIGCALYVIALILFFIMMNTCHQG